MRTKFKNVASLLFIVLFASCSREGIVENGETDNGKIAVATEVSVDGVKLTTRAASEAGYTTGDGLYDKGDDVTVAAHANDGYELTAFYDKKHPSTNLGASHKLTVAIPQIFKAEFRKKSFTITVNASPIDGGTVTGGGSYNKGATCTLTATPNNGYTFDGWYEGSTKVSTSSSYNFTVSSNRTMTAKFVPTPKEITITLEFSYDEFILRSSAPVTTDIVVRQTIHYLEENVCDGYISRDSDMDIEVIIPKGQTTATYKVSTGNDSCTTTSLTFSQEISAPWIGKTINGAVYKISGNWLM